MTEFFTTEIILAGTLVSLSAMAMTASIVVLRPPKDRRPTVDLDAFVRNAPYHRLREIGIVVEEPAA
ncbi:hypothetical protein [Citreimonas salinaria]|uniref:Uncharacterized protein n=1 Tax=Citreimonas salinaria TaxID=321339 RepID=A0A1H3N9U4_9RHOB|nr:hypothetical protein [Citreimonas salinaria]SDY85721.1 hypothetical protein SAMN05444340_12211 [Citreimonas salinaria]